MCRLIWCDDGSLRGRPTSRSASHLLRPASGRLISSDCPRMFTFIERRLESAPLRRSAQTWYIQGRESSAIRVICPGLETSVSALVHWQPTVATGVHRQIRTAFDGGRWRPAGASGTHRHCVPNFGGYWRPPSAYTGSHKRITVTTGCHRRPALMSGEVHRATPTTGR